MKVADLTLDELRAFIRETVDERLAEIAEDVDDLELRPEFVEALKRSLAQRDQTIDADEMFRELELHPEFVALLNERLESADDHVDFHEALKARRLTQ
jgi:hypothetical protein